MNNNSITGVTSITGTGGSFVTTTSPPDGDDSTNIATTEFVQNAVSGGVGGYALLTKPDGSFQTFTTPINFSSSLQSNSVTVATLNNLPIYTLSGLSLSNNYGYNSTIVAPIPTIETMQQNATTLAYVNFFSTPLVLSIGSVGGLPIFTPFLQYNFTTVNFTGLQKPWPNFPPSNTGGGYQWVTVTTTSLVGNVFSTISQTWPVIFSYLNNVPQVTFYTYYNMGANTTATYDFSTLGIFAS
jgi:hypothetical protein